MPEVEEARPTGAQARRNGQPKDSGKAGGGRSSRRRGQLCDVEGGDGDIGWCSGTAEGAAGGGAVTATPLFTGEDASSVVFPRNGGDAGEEDAPARPRVATAHGRGGTSGWRRPAPGKEKEAAGRGGAATGELGKRKKRENGRRGSHFIGAGWEERGTAVEMAAGGHGRWPGMARPFRVNKSTNQGRIRGELKRKERGLIPPNQFWNPMFESRGFVGGIG
uniref:Uncharacterized protein n=1 Tax=Oryza sativa subsp. japonica TaxID=39947 RepID=Q2R4Q6_ORYSJ|nr:hypothetical protein LOC_Os11g27660 [Oryza sativa Japonica Group]